MSGFTGYCHVRTVKGRTEHFCFQCRKPIAKNERHRIEKYLMRDDEGFLAFRTRKHLRCAYKEISWSTRFENFQKRCQHPESRRNEVWKYIEGEAVMEPDYTECLNCRQKVVEW